MAIDEKLLHILRCPKCKGELERERDDTAFFCRVCRLRYPVVEDIPNFLLTDAQPLKE